MKAIKILMTTVVAMIFLSSCDDKIDNSLNYYTPHFSITLPDNLSSAKTIKESFEVKNVSTGRTTTYSAREDVNLKVGLYDITYEAEMSVTGDSVEHRVTAFNQSVELTSANQLVKMQAYESMENEDFVIQEIFFTGTLQSSGNQYNGDDYIILYNNTDHVLYADGLTLLESYFTTTQKYNYTPNIMDEAMTVQALYTIPGSGKEHPVQPGESLKIADTGIDHRVANPNSFDLSDADFEWYDVSNVASQMDIDGPNVPNLDKWYCYTNSFYVLHNRGFKAWAIARIPKSKEEYLNNYRYTFTYEVVVPAGSYPMSQTKYYIPNEWIVDAVNCSVASEYAWNVTSPSLDRGWTYCGTMDHDKTRYFHSVRRKMLYLKDGKPVLKDTNNSAEDFNPYCIPSEIERQGTAIDMNGTKCTTQTWDGVTPKNN